MGQRRGLSVAGGLRQELGLGVESGEWRVESGEWRVGIRLWLFLYHPLRRRLDGRVGAGRIG
jgi:hypothetical protein